jgi:leucyl aminopeptidase (aminopeptidase T)
MELYDENVLKLVHFAVGIDYMLYRVVSVVEFTSER